jgi:hypothetical protein
MPVLLDPVDESLAKVAFLIKKLVILSLKNAILLRRDRRRRPGRLDRRPGIMARDQGLALVDVRLLAAAQDELNGVPQPVDGDVRLGPEAAPPAPGRRSAMPESPLESPG